MARALLGVIGPVALILSRRTKGPEFARMAATAIFNVSPSPSPAGGTDLAPAEPSKGGGGARDGGGDAFSQALASLMGALIVPQQTPQTTAGAPAETGAAAVGATAAGAQGFMLIARAGERQSGRPRPN